MKKKFFSSSAIIFILLFIFIGFVFLYFNIKLFKIGIEQREAESGQYSSQQKEILTAGSNTEKITGANECEQKVTSLISGYITKKTATAIFISQGQGEQEQGREVLVLPDTRYLKIKTNKKGETLSSEAIEYFDIPDFGSIVAVVYDIQGNKANGEVLKYLVFE